MTNWNSDKQTRQESHWHWSAFRETRLFLAESAQEPWSQYVKLFKPALVSTRRALLDTESPAAFLL